jgi:hypothetical protein
MANTWSYDNTLPSNKDKARFILGDTDTQNQLIYDEEINAALALKGQLRTACIMLCESLAARFIKFTQTRGGETTADRTAVSDKYEKLAKRLRKVGQKGFAVLTQSQKDVYESDSDLLQTSVKRGSMDNPVTDGNGTDNNGGVLQ